MHIRDSSVIMEKMPTIFLAKVTMYFLDKYSFKRITDLHFKERNVSDIQLNKNEKSPLHVKL